MSHSKQKGTKSCANNTFGLSQDSPPRYPLFTQHFFAIFIETRFLASLCFSIIGTASDHQTQKGLTDQALVYQSHRDQTRSKTFINDKTYKYVFYEFYTPFSLGQKNPEPNFVLTFLIGTQQYIISTLFFPALSDDYIFLPSLNYRISLPEVFGKKCVLKNFPKFTEKQLRRRLFL